MPKVLITMPDLWAWGRAGQCVPYPSPLCNDVFTTLMRRCLNVAGNCPELKCAKNVNYNTKIVGFGAGWAVFLFRTADV